MTIFDDHIVCIKIHIQTNTSIVGVLLEVIQHPVLGKGSNFLIVDKVFTVRIITEVIKNAMSEDLRSASNTPSAGTILGCNESAE